MDAAARLAARLADYAAGHWDTDDIPGLVREALAAGPIDVDTAVSALNAEANAISGAHEGETSDTIREDDRANLFVNVAGYMLRNDTAGKSYPAIVDAVIVAGWGADLMQPGELYCEYAWPEDYTYLGDEMPFAGEVCGEDVTAKVNAHGTTYYVHGTATDQEHDPVITEAGQRDALITRVREWSD